MSSDTLLTETRLMTVRSRSFASRAGRLALATAVATVAAGALVRGGPVAAGFTFTTPVAIPNSSGLGEPSLAIDSAGRLFVTAPQSLGNVTGGGSPVWTSTTRGASWNAGVAPTGDPLSGGDTDLAVDAADNVYQTDLWLGNTAMAVSTDHGQSFIANEYGHTTPGDDRPWLAYSKKDNALYMAWDGFTALYAQKSLPLVAPQAGILPGQTVPVIGESAVALGGGPSLPVRECVCPPGGIAVDNSSGPGAGTVYVTYSRQNGGSDGGAVGVGISTDSGLTWTNTSIPGTGSTGSAFDVEYNFIPVKVDSNGTVYAVWGEGRNITTDANGNSIATGGVAIRYAYSTDHGIHWSTPRTLSTQRTTTFPTLDVVSLGVIDVAWYGTTASGDPNLVGPKASWDVDFAQVLRADTSSPQVTSATAVSGIHHGCIQTGGSGSSLCSDRSLLDFFQLAVDHSGLANIIYTKGDATRGTTLMFTRQSGGTTVTATKHVAAPAAGRHTAAADQPRAGRRPAFRSIFSV